MTSPTLPRRHDDGSRYLGAFARPADHSEGSVFSKLCEWLLKACVVLVPVLSAWASTKTIAGLPPIRILAALLVVLAAVCRHRLSSVTQVLLLLTLAWGCIGIALMKDVIGFKEVIGVVVGLLTMVAMTMVADSREWIVTVCRAWLLGMVVAIVPGILEVVTGRHLPNYREGSPAWIRTSATDIASFLVNPNLFAYFLAAGMIVMVVGWQLEDSRLMKAMYLGCTFVSFPLILLTGSRLTLLACLFIVAWLLLRSRVLAIVSAVLAAAAALMIVVTGWLPRLLTIIGDIIHDLSSNSGRSRLAVYRDAGWMFVDSHGMGIGPGQFQTQVLWAPWPTRGTIDPHNGFVEVFLGYGLLLGVVLVALAAAVLWCSIRRQWAGDVDPVNRVLAEALTVSMLVIPVIALSNSSYLKNPVVWAQMATVAVFCEFLRPGATAGLEEEFAGKCDADESSRRTYLERRSRLVRGVVDRAQRPDTSRPDPSTG